MSNKILTAEEAFGPLVELLNKATPAMRAAVIYNIQSSVGGFPRDPKKEEEIKGALTAEGHDPEHGL